MRFSHSRVNAGDLTLRTRRLPYRGALLAGVSAVFIGTPALAQDAPSNQLGLGEIVITAQKRAQSLEDVPVAVTALTGEAITAQRIEAFTDLTRAAASLTITEQTTSPNSSIVVRGIGTFAYSIGAEPSVSVLVDDVPVVQQAQAFDSLSDLERIEVLRGPQGTLFGKNASAGLINIVTKDPSANFSGSGSLSLTTDGERRGEVTVSGPIAGDSGFRLTGYYDKFDGNIRNLTNDDTLGGFESYGIRAKLLFKPVDNVKVVLSAGYASKDQNGTAQTWRFIGPGVPKVPHTAVFLLPLISGITPSESNYDTRVNYDSPTTNRQLTLSGRAEVDLGRATLTSVTSYQDWRYKLINNDIDGTESTDPDGNILAAGPFRSKQFTQELRLASKGDGRLGYVGGLFFADANTTRSYQRTDPILADFAAKTGSRSIAGFAQVDFALTPGTRITGGVRVNNEHISVNYTNFLPGAPCAIACTGTHNDTAVTWKGVIQQDLARHVMAYFSVATGYKGYAYDVTTSFGPFNATNPVLPEKSRAFELGLKGRFLGGRVQANIDAFYSRYNNFQAQASEAIADPTTGRQSLVNQLNNVGRSRTKGVEADVSGKVAPWLRLDVSAAYTEANIVSFPLGNCYPGLAVGQLGCQTIVVGATSANVRELAGGVLPNAPRLKYTIGATVEKEVGNEIFILGTVNYQHQSSVEFDLFQDPLTVQGPYGIMNANFQLKMKNFRVGIFANNLLNKHYASELANSYSIYNHVQTISQVLPRNSQRYLGVKLGFDF